MIKEEGENMNELGCSGCLACKYICPQNAIEMIENEKGFLYPRINKAKCTNCGLCGKKCRENHFNNGKEYYAAINKNNDEKMTSASGAIFPLLAKYTFDNNGVVCGVSYDENMKVKHMFANNMEEAKKFKGSKYVRSDTTLVFEKIKEYLENEKFVLFVGTPCQVNGIKIFLGKDYNNLLLCDLICHSNPSQKVFSKYIEHLEKAHNKKIVDFIFRDKNVGWHGSNCKAIFSDGSAVSVDNIYSQAFLAGAISHEGCYSCKYAGINRVGDITIGDFWGVEKLYPEFLDDKGVSLVLVNNEKGKKVFDSISNNLKIKKISKEEALKYNHNRPIGKHKNYDKIFNKLDSKDFIKYLRKYVKTPLYKSAFIKLKQTIKKL